MLSLTMIESSACLWSIHSDADPKVRPSPLDPTMQVVEPRFASSCVAYSRPDATALEQAVKDSHLRSSPTFVNAAEEAKNVFFGASRHAVHRTDAE
jgi:hypothetical protein